MANLKWEVSCKPGDSELANLSIFKIQLQVIQPPWPNFIPDSTWPFDFGSRFHSLSQVTSRIARRGWFVWPVHWRYQSQVYGDISWIPKRSKRKICFFLVIQFVTLFGGWLSDLFRGESWPLFGSSKGHIESPGCWFLFFIPGMSEQLVHEIS